MASLSRRKTGEWVVKYHDDVGNRTLYLGRIKKRSAEEICRHAERLVESRRANVALPPETAAWVGGVDERLRVKLERLGLIRPGMGYRRVTLAEFTETYIDEKRPESSPLTIKNLDDGPARSATSPQRTRRRSAITSSRPAACGPTPSAPIAGRASSSSPRRLNAASRLSTRSGK